jgi:TetR/AcrR family transcriptional repressor of nem operon
METATKGDRTRARVIAEATALINRRGFANTSISDLIEATGVKKGNLYFHFTSKEELGLELIRQARDEYFLYLEENARGETPGAKIAGVLDAVYKIHRKRGFVGGCIFGNMALEMADVNGEFAALVRGIFEQWVRVLAKLICQAQESGEVRGDLKPEAAARLIVASLEGGIMMSRLSKDGSDMLECVKSVKTMLGI